MMKAYINYSGGIHLGYLEILDNWEIKVFLLESSFTSPSYETFTDVDVSFRATPTLSCAW